MGRARAAVHARVRDRDERQLILAAALRRTSVDARRPRLVSGVHTNETIIARAFDARGRTIVLKVAHTERGASALNRHVTAVEAVRLTASPSLRRLIPAVLHQARREPWHVVVESALPGRPLSEAHLPARLRGERAALVALDGVHTIDAQVTAAPSELLETWVDAPLAEVGRHVAPCRFEQPLRHLRDELTTALSRPLPLARSHGDVWAGNLLVSPTGRVTGLVDWEASRALAPIGTDVMQFALSSYERSIGSVVADALVTGAMPPGISTGLRRAAERGHHELGLRSTLLLAWLWHVDENLRKSAHYAGSWIDTNVEPVLRSAGLTGR